MRNSLGEKIKFYRKRAGLSQLELETSIEASPGSLSRIESGQVNPTKETLSKISRVLKLKSSEVADLLDLKIFTLEELVIAINKITRSLDLNTTLQTAVDIMFDLYPNYNGGIILLIDTENPDRIYARTISKMPNSYNALKLLPDSFENLPIFISKRKDNLVVKCVVNEEVYQSSNLWDFGRGTVPQIATDAISKLLGFKRGIVLPMKYDSQVIGATLFTKRVDEDFSEEEIRILELLTEQFSVSIMNAKNYQQLITNIN
jgi:transcriptional regulator with XRE-family HTH domain